MKKLLLLLFPITLLGAEFIPYPHAPYDPSLTEKIVPDVHLTFQFTPSVDSLNKAYRKFHSDAEVDRRNEAGIKRVAKGFQDSGEDPQALKVIELQTYCTCYMFDCYNIINRGCNFGNPITMNEYRQKFLSTVYQMVSSRSKIAFVFFASSNFATPARLLLDFYKAQSTKKDKKQLIDLAVYSIDPINQTTEHYKCEKAFIEMVQHAKASYGIYPCDHIQLTQLALVDSVDSFTKEVKIDEDRGIVCTGYGYNNPLRYPQAKPDFLKLVSSLASKHDKVAAVTTLSDASSFATHEISDALEFLDSNLTVNLLE